MSEAQQSIVNSMSPYGATIELISSKFATTPWAMEKFTQLLHGRYRNIARQLTLMATNATLNDLPGDVKSRLGDGRAMVCKVAGVDQRPMNEWEATQL